MSYLVKDCRDPWTELDVQADGDVHPCCHAMLSVGSLREESLEAIWTGRRLATFRKFLESPTPLPACATCPVRPWREAAGRTPPSALRRMWGWATRVFVTRTPHLLRVWTDRGEYGGSELVRLRIGVRLGTTALPGRVQLTLAAAGPAGDRLWLSFAGRFLQLLGQPAPLLDTWEPFSFEELELGNSPAGDLDPGVWTCTLALMPAGSDPGDTSAWLASALCTFRVSPRATRASPRDRIPARGGA